MKRRRRWSAIGLWVMWWAALTAALWLLAGILGQSADPAGCAASAVLVIVVGEAGDRLRRRIASRRRTG
ncbi:hypothetical protein ACWEF9_34195 [Streptomyces sp. NPDC004980]